MYYLSITVMLFTSLIMLYEINKSINKVVCFLEKENDLMMGEMRESGETLSSYEVEKQQRDKEFDERILGLQKELDTLGNFGTPAEVFHEDVYNIPHSEGIPTSKDDVEIAD